jgi:dTDP-4-amino-4,6-dideoxygalactose transaminase
MKVPFVDLYPQYTELKAEIDAALETVISKGQFIQGKPVKDFESQLASSIGVKHAAGCANATMGGWVLLKAMNIGPGDEVITTPLTAVPTAEYMTLAGATPVFADIDPATYQLCPVEVEKKINERTKALMPVHLYGIPANLDAFLALGKKYNLPVIEDCAQAQGAEWKGKRIGSYGFASCWSFFPSKNLGGFGDGGAVTTDDAAIDEYVRMFVDHGRKEKFTHDFPGANLRLDGLQAAILSVKLTKLDEWNARRRAIAEIYDAGLADVAGIVTPKTYQGSTPVWHLYVIRSTRRDDLRKYLNEKGISTGLHYPLPLHLQPAFAGTGAEGAFPEAERATQEIVSLPMYPHMEPEMAHAVVAAIKEFVASK